MGIYVYCTEDEKKRIDRARRESRQTISGYMLAAAMRQIELDEAKRAKSR